MATYQGAHTGAEVDDAVGVTKGAGTGLIAKTATGAGAKRAIAGTTGQVTVTNGDGVAGNPTISLPSQVTASLSLANSAQQPPAEGPFVNGDKTKLDGIEAGADVTDTANVTAAGALMDSEVTNLAAVKAFDPTDYATAAQGPLADSATQPGDNISTLTNDAAFVRAIPRV